jgi:hypothetical protein
MILTNQQKQIITEDGVYKCIFTQKPFSYSLFGSELSPIGDIAIFTSPTLLGKLFIEDALVCCGELPNTNIFGGVCFERLFLTQIASLIFQTTDQTCVISDNALFINEKQASIVVTTNVKNTSLFHVILPLKSSYGALHSLDLNSIEDFQIKANEIFYKILQSVHLETRRDNF